jgi:hypothetical protein
VGKSAVRKRDYCGSREENKRRKSKDWRTQKITLKIILKKYK